MENLRVTTNKLYVGDSSYLIGKNPNERVSLVIRNVLKGEWAISRSTENFVAAHNSVKCHADDNVVCGCTGYELAGTVLVDAAHVCIGSLTKLSRMTNDDYRELILGDTLSSDKRATFTSTDDGRYDVYVARDTDGRVVAIAVPIEYDCCDECGEHIDCCECCVECYQYNCVCDVCEVCESYWCEC